MDRRREADAGIREPGQGVGPLEAETCHIDLDEVRLDLLEIHRDARLVETVARASCASVVVREPVDVVIERVEPGRGDDPGLPHRSAEEVLLAPAPAP